MRNIFKNTKKIKEAYWSGDEAVVWGLTSKDLRDVRRQLKMMKDPKYANAIAFLTDVIHWKETNGEDV